MVVGAMGGGKMGAPGSWHSRGKHQKLEAADEAEDEQGAGYVAAEAVVHLLGVLRGGGG